MAETLAEIEFNENEELNRFVVLFKAFFMNQNDHQSDVLHRCYEIHARSLCIDLYDTFQTKEKLQELITLTHSKLIKIYKEQQRLQNPLLTKIIDFKILLECLVGSPSLRMATLATAFQACLDLTGLSLCDPARDQQILDQHIAAHLAQSRQISAQFLLQSLPTSQLLKYTSIERDFQQQISRARTTAQLQSIINIFEKLRKDEK